MTRQALCVWLAMCVFAAVAVARPGMVKTTDGQSFDGEIDEQDANAVVVNVRGIQNRIERSRVASIEYADDFARQFNQRLTQLGPADVEGRLALSREAFAQKQYLLARQAAESAQQIDSNSADAVAMLETIRSQMRMEAAKQRPHDPARATTEPSTHPAGGQRVLSAEQINAIRQAELRPEDTGVRVRFERDVKKRYYTSKGMTFQEFNALTPQDQVAAILKDGTPEMRRDVIILSDPPAMMMYRMRVQPWVLQNCATSGCHDLRSGQKFGLIDPADSEADTYTNFHTLQTYAKQLKTEDNNVFERGELRMIDRQSPEDSMLIQYALPVNVAKFDHPEVRDYRPPLRGVTDPRYKLVLDWVGKSLSPIDPDYGFRFEPTGRGPSTAPASGPTTTTRATTRPAPVPGPRPAR